MAGREAAGVGRARSNPWVERLVESKEQGARSDGAGARVSGFGVVERLRAEQRARSGAGER